MPRGRPKSEKSIAAKEKLANMTDEQIEAEKEQRAKEKEAKRLAKIERQKIFTAGAIAHRAKVSKLSGPERKAYFAKNAEKGKIKRKKLQGDLLFPVRTMKKMMRYNMGLKKTFKGHKNEGRKVTTEAAIFTTAVLEYLTAEVMELSGECAKSLKKSRIVPRHILAAVRMDEELSVFMPRTVTISQAGVLPKPIPHCLAKNNVPRKEWTQGPNEIGRETHIIRQKDVVASAAGSHAGEVNNNK